MILTGKQLMKLREEYARNVVEHMTRREMHCYLIQVMYNEVSYADGEQLRDRLSISLDKLHMTEWWRRLLPTSNKPHPAIAELTVQIKRVAI